MKRSEFKNRKRCRREIRMFFTSKGVPYPSEEEGIPFILKLSHIFLPTREYILTAPVGLGNEIAVSFTGISRQEIEECLFIEFVDNKKYKIEKRICYNARGFYATVFFTAIKEV